MLLYKMTTKILQLQACRVCYLNFDISGMHVMIILTDGLSILLTIVYYFMAGDSTVSPLMSNETGPNPQTSAQLESIKVPKVSMPLKKTEPFHIQLEQGHAIRNYQHELAEPGLQGENCMIVAPTGSGKTLVGAIVITDHLNKNMNNPRCHVGFITPTKLLADQQKLKLEAYIPGVRVGIVTGDFKIGLAESISTNNITVCTAGKLHEELYHSKLSISHFSLLILDECHHTVKEHPYAQLMKFYLEKKLEARRLSTLPETQIIGMTASPGSGQRRSLIVMKTYKHLKNLMAHLDSSGGIKTVTQYEEELKRCSNRPTVECRELEPRKTTDDPFIAGVLQAMEKIEREFLQELAHCKSRRWSQDYFTKVKQIIFIEEMSIDDDCRDRISASEQLYAYSSALSVYMDMRSEDAIKVINKFAEEFPAADKATPIETSLKALNDELLSKISSLPPKQNPMLDEIGSILLKQFQQNYLSCAIVFVRLRDHTVAMKDWIANNPHLKKVGIVPGNITGYTKKGDDVTRAKQEATLKQFHEGKINVLVTTSVAEEGLDIPECNLVLRYQYVSNEIAKTQAEGRARAEDSNCYSIVSSHSSKKYQELRNEELLMQVEGIIKCGIFSTSVQFKEELEEIQQDIVREVKRNEQIQKLKKSNPACSVELLCKKCKVFACKGSDIRTLNEDGPSHYLVPRPEFREKFRRKRHHKPDKLTETIFKTHKIYCVKCDYDWGVQAVSSLSDDHYPVIKCSSFIFKIGDSSRPFKKWIDVPFQVKPLNKN